MINKSHGRLICSLSGTALSQEDKAIIAHSNSAGIVLFDKNYDPNNIKLFKQLLVEIQDTAKHAGKKYFPVFVDQEGGDVQRLRRGGLFTALCPAGALSRLYEISYLILKDNQASLCIAKAMAKEEGQLMAAQLLTWGIISFAPVLDLDQGNVVISGLSRAFHSDPVICTELAEAYIEGMNTAGMMATGKHFPGHGHDVGDSHEIQPVDHRSFSEIWDQDLIPFRYLIEKNKLAAIMLAHITYPQVDAENTVGNSKIWIHDILRKELNFQGICISDCLSMKGATGGSYLDKVNATFAAGIDIALLCNIPAIELLTVLDGMGERYLASVELQERLARWVHGASESMDLLEHRDSGLLRRSKRSVIS